MKNLPEERRAPWREALREEVLRGENLSEEEERRGESLRGGKVFVEWTSPKREVRCYFQVKFTLGIRPTRPVNKWTAC